MSEVSVSAGQVMLYNGDETEFTLRFEVSKPFVESGGATVLGGSTISDDYLDVACTVDDGIISHEGFDIFATENALSNPYEATYKVSLLKTSGARYCVLYRHLKVPATPNPTTLGALQAYSNESVRARANTYTKAEIDAMIGNLISAMQKATEVAYGAVRLDVPAVLASDPVAVGANSPLLTGAGVGATTTIFRSNYDTAAEAYEAAAGKTLQYTEEEAISASQTIPANVYVTLDGDGVFNVAAGQTLTIENLEAGIDRQLNIGPGKLVIKNYSVLKASIWIGKGATTTVTEAIDGSETIFDVADGNFSRAPLPYTAMIGDEQVRVTSKTSTTVTVTRGYNDTTPDDHSNGATLSQIPELTAAMWQGIRESVYAMGGGTVEWGANYVLTAGGLTPVNGLVMRGSGGVPDSLQGTTFLLTENNTNIFQIGGGLRNVFFEYCNFKCTIEGSATSRVGATCIDISGRGIATTGPDIAADPGTYNVGFYQCNFYQGEYGVNVYDQVVGANTWLMISLKFDLCYWIGQTVAGFRSNTANTSYAFEDCSWTPDTNDECDAVLLDYSGPTRFQTCTFNGLVATGLRAYCTDITNINTSTGLITVPNHHCEDLEPVVLRARQMIRQTVVAPSNITVAGNAKCVVTIAGVATTVQFAVTIAWTANQIATAARTALAANAAVAAFFTVGGTGANIDLTEIAMAGRDDNSLNCTIEDVTSAGITDDLTSVRLDALPTDPDADVDRYWFDPVDSNTGYLYRVPQHINYPSPEDYRVIFDDDGLSTITLRTTVLNMTGQPRAAIHVKNSICGIHIQNCQDEGFPYSLLVEDTFERRRAIVINDGTTMQGIVQLNSQCLILAEASFFLAHSFKDSLASNGARVYSKGNNVFQYGGGNSDITGTEMYSPAHFDAFVGTSSFVEITGEEQLTRFNQFTKVVLGRLFDSVAGPAFEVSRNNYDDQCLLRVGLKESWEEEASTFYDFFMRADTIDDPLLEGYLSLEATRPGQAGDDLEFKGLYVQGGTANRGPHYEMLQIEVTDDDTPGVFTIDCSLADSFYLTPTQDSVIHFDNSRGFSNQGRFVKVVVFANGTDSYYMQWGLGCDTPGAQGWHTGYVAARWVSVFYSTADDFDMIAPPCPARATGEGPGPIVDTYRLITTEPPTVVDLVANVPYCVETTGRALLRLPAKFNFGDKFQIIGKGTGGYRLKHGHATHYIIFNDGGVVGTDQSTTGTSGYIETGDNPYSAICLVCTDADARLQVESIYGDFTVV